MTTAGAASASAPVFDRFSIWGTSAVLGVTDPAKIAEARLQLDLELELIEQAASRFRDGTEILELNRRAGQGAIEVSPVLLDLIVCALDADAETAGACDPTVADALIALGYDRDFDDVEDSSTISATTPAPGTSGIIVDPAAMTVDLPLGVHLDLGATAKARAADRAAIAIAGSLRTGVLVDLGGDLRTAGEAPTDGWKIGITTEARSGRIDAVDEVISVTAGLIDRRAHMEGRRSHGSPCHRSRHRVAGDQNLDHGHRGGQHLRHGQQSVDRRPGLGRGRALRAATALDSGTSGPA